MTLPVLEALRDPRAIAAWEVSKLELLIRQARRANVLSRLAVELQEANLLSQLPAAPRAHFEAARVVARAQEEAIRREVAQVSAAVQSARTTAVLLKGAGYLFAGVPAARGRLFSDVDILVPRAALPAVEASLMLRGWVTTHHNAYDQRYYREWMHELPPMQHVTRQSVLDVHHAILPQTARLRSDSAKLLEAARPVEGDPVLRVLAPVDMVLHSATHLFLNEEFGNGLRDLADLDVLIRHFAAAEPGFWQKLTIRAKELGLGRPLFYALRYTKALLGTPIDSLALRNTEEWAPAAWRLPLMDALFFMVLRPDHPSANGPLAPLARQALYVRAHWLRMPVPLLVRHLAVKAWRGREEPVPAAR